MQQEKAGADVGSEGAGDAEGWIIRAQRGARRTRTSLPAAVAQSALPWGHTLATHLPAWPVLWVVGQVGAGLGLLTPTSFCFLPGSAGNGRPPVCGRWGSKRGQNGCPRVLSCSSPPLLCWSSPSDSLTVREKEPSAPTTGQLPPPATWQAHLCVWPCWSGSGSGRGEAEPRERLTPPTCWQCCVSHPVVSGLSSPRCFSPPHHSLWPPQRALGQP